MTRSELPNNSLKTDSLTPNAPFHYVVAGSQGIMLAAATMLLLYIIIVVVGLICGLGWGSFTLANSCLPSTIRYRCGCVMDL